VSILISLGLIQDDGAVDSAVGSFDSRKDGFANNCDIAPNDGVAQSQAAAVLEVEIDPSLETQGIR